MRIVRNYRDVVARYRDIHFHRIGANLDRVLKGWDGILGQHGAGSAMSVDQRAGGHLEKRYGIISSSGGNCSGGRVGSGSGSGAKIDTSGSAAISTGASATGSTWASAADSGTSHSQQSLQRLQRSQR